MLTTDQLVATMAEADCIIVEGDCMQLLPLLPPGSMGLTVTDPPYESLEKHRAKGTTTRLKVSKASSNEWYDTFPNESYGEFFKWLYLAQAANSHCYVFCDSETEHVILSGQIPYHEKPSEPLRRESLLATHVVRARYVTALDVGWIAWPTLTWVKTRRGMKKPDRDALMGLSILLSKPEKEVESLGSFLWQRLVDLAEWLLRKGMGYHWSRCTERILFLEKGRKQLNDQKWPDVFFGPRAAKGEHPSKKPDNVILRLILNSTQEGEWVLDPFAGSGVVGVGALACGRKAILAEVDMKYIKEIEWATGKRIVHLKLQG